jgi:kinesin family protein 18/19
MTESTNINKSLLSLANCIITLNSRQFTNFRDSKLTRILKDSLCGNSRTLMIACVSKEAENYEDTFKTLDYCKKASKIEKIRVRKEATIENSA